MFESSQVFRIAHWFCGHKDRFRYAREKRYHPLMSTLFNRQRTFKIRFKTNRWNYKQAYKDMP